MYLPRPHRTRPGEHKNRKHAMISTGHAEDPEHALEFEWMLSRMPLASGEQMSEKRQVKCEMRMRGRTAVIVWLCALQ